MVRITKRKKKRNSERTEIYLYSINRNQIASFISEYNKTKNKTSEENFQKKCKIPEILLNNF